VPTLLIALFAMLSLFRFKLGMITTIGCSAALGLLHHIAPGQSPNSLKDPAPLVEGYYFQQGDDWHLIWCALR
jgi:hypothetical protein